MKNNLALNSTNLNDSKIEKWESNTISSESFFKIKPRHIKILKVLETNPHLTLSQKILEKETTISKSSFYRSIKKMEAYGFLLTIPKAYPKMVKVHPDIIFLLSHFFQGTYPESHKTRVPSKNPQNSKRDPEKRKTDDIHFPKKVDYRENSDTGATLPSEIPSNKIIDPLIIRSHNYFFKIPIQRKPALLDKMLSKTKWFEKHHMKNWSYFQGKLSMFGCKAVIQFNPSVVTVWLNNIFGRNPFENDLEANKRILEVKGYLEDYYRGLYLAPHVFIRRVENQGTEHGWIHHHLALKAKQQNISLKGKDWEIDSSSNTPELESNNKLASSEHLSEELEDFDYRSTNGIYFRDIHQNQKQHLDLIKGIQDSQIKISEVLKKLTEPEHGPLRHHNIPRQARITKQKLSPLQNRVFTFISINKGLNRKEISNKSKIKIGSVNSSIARLKKLKYVQEINSRIIPV